MKTTLGMLAFILNAVLVNAQAPSWAWAKGAGGNLGQINTDSQSTIGTNLTTDINGNVYTVGYFETPTMIVGNYTLTNANNSGNEGEVFIVKYDPTGNVVWAKSAKGDSSDSGAGILIDNANNVYITGDFASPTLTFDSKTITNTNSGTDDIFIAKYNAAGNIIWAKSYGGNKDDNGNAIIKDLAGDIYITGNFKSQVFNIGNNILNIDSLGNQDMFVAKFDTSCNPIYVKNVGKGCHIPITSSDIVSDFNNNIYITGGFTNHSAIIGIDTLHCNSNSNNFFLAKYDVLGNLLWVKEGKGLNYDAAVNSIGLDIDGNIYAAGNFAGNSLAIGNYTLSTSCCYTGFIAKYSPSGTVLWAKSTLVNNPQAWPLTAITVDSNYGVYIGGGFFNQVNGLPPLVFGNDTLIDGNPGMDAIFIAKYDSSGNAVWGKTAKSTRWNTITGITTDKYNNIFSIGYYDSPSLIFDNDTLFNLNHGQWNGDYFIAKIGTIGVGIEKYSMQNNITVYPIPSSGSIHITSKTAIDELKITDLIGQTVYETKPRASNKELMLDNAGVYFITVTCGAEVTTKKVIVNK